MKLKIAELDIIYLSYDEPNAEENYADLLSKVPWAKRVHGVEGSDAAHKACADLSDTKHFVTVDGDTIIDPKFIEVVLDLDKLGVDDDYQFSWCGKIDVNGLMYGNGSLKMWTKEFVKNMQTHENTDGTDQTSIEFIKNEDTRGEGVTAFKIKVNDIKSIKRKATELKLLVDGEIVIGGVKFFLS